MGKNIYKEHDDNFDEIREQFKHMTIKEKDAEFERLLKEDMEKSENN